MEAAALTIGGDGVEATLRRADCRVDWGAGCDGAYSVVRLALAASFSGETINSDWILTDVHMKGYPFPDTEVAVYWTRRRASEFPISPGRYRLIASIPPAGADHLRDPTPEQIRTIAERPRGASLLDPVSLSGFRINSLTRERVTIFVRPGAVSRAETPISPRGNSSPKNRGGFVLGVPASIDLLVAFYL